jgi:hypothetical protein
VLFAFAIGSALTAHGLDVQPVRAQDSDPTALERRLPASVAGHPIRVDPGTDLGAWIGEAFSDERQVSIEALDAALAAQDAGRADVRLAWAVSGVDGEVVITGFQLPGGDARALRDPIWASTSRGWTRSQGPNGRSLDTR